MKTMRIAILALLGAAVVGGGLYIMMRSDQPAGTNSTSDSSTSGNGRSLAQVAASGDPTMCTFTINDATQNSEWTIYTADQKVRGDYTGTLAAGSGTIEGHIITDGEYNYNWGSRGTTTYGTKLKLSVVQNSNSTPTTSDLDANQNFDMDCQRWAVDNSKFTPPTDVTFTDLSARVEPNTNGSGASKAAACAACNLQTEEAAKAQCRQVLGC